MVADLNRFPWVIYSAIQSLIHSFIRSFDRHWSIYHFIGPDFNKVLTSSSSSYTFSFIVNIGTWISCKLINRSGDRISFWWCTYYSFCVVVIIIVVAKISRRGKHAINSLWIIYCVSSPYYHQVVVNLGATFYKRETTT